MLVLAPNLGVARSASLAKSSQLRLTSGGGAMDMRQMVAGARLATLPSPRRAGLSFSSSTPTRPRPPRRAPAAAGPQRQAAPRALAPRCAAQAESRTPVAAARACRARRRRLRPGHRASESAETMDAVI